MKFINNYIEETEEICKKIDRSILEKIINEICKVRNRHGRIFFLGVGGSAAHASHAVNDFRKLANIECYTPTDNVSELTARTNDDGWKYVFRDWLKTSKLNSKDLIFVFSVGGGDAKKQISENLILALKFAKTKKTKICGVVGKNGGYTKKVSKACLTIPANNKKLITPHTEGFAAIVWHLIISHPRVQKNKTTW